MDVIEIRGIRTYGRVGATDAERSREQRLDIDVRIEVDLSAAARSDALEQTISYASLHDRVVRTVQERSFFLVERLASELLATIFDDVRVACAEVSIAKPSLLDGATPVVTLRRGNPGYIASCL